MTVNSVISVTAYLILAPIIACLLSGVDRIVTARMQGRRGPGLLQPWYDIIKLFAKENTSVNDIQNILVMAHCFFAIFSGAIFFAGGDLLLVLFALTMAEVFLILAAYSVNAAYSELGAQRELLQMMAYEPMTLLTAVGFYISSGSFRVGQIIGTELPHIITMPGFFAGLLLGTLFLTVIGGGAGLSLGMATIMVRDIYKHRVFILSAIAGLLLGQVGGGIGFPKLPKL